MTERTTHFRTELGALCGAPEPFASTQTDVEATCWACRALLDSGLRRRRDAPPGGARRTVPLGRLRGGE